MKVEKGMYPSGRLQKDWDNPGDTIKVKEDMKVGHGIDAATNCISEQNTRGRKRISPGKPNLGLDTKSERSQK